MCIETRMMVGFVGALKTASFVFVVVVMVVSNFFEDRSFFR